MFELLKATRPEELNEAIAELKRDLDLVREVQPSPFQDYAAEYHEIASHIEHTPEMLPMIIDEIIPWTQKQMKHPLLRERYVIQRVKSTIQSSEDDTDIVAEGSEHLSNLMANGLNMTDEEMDTILKWAEENTFDF